MQSVGQHSFVGKWRQRVEKKYKQAKESNDISLSSSACCGISSTEKFSVVSYRVIRWISLELFKLFGLYFVRKQLCLLQVKGRRPVMLQEEGLARQCCTPATCQPPPHTHRRTHTRALHTSYLGLSHCSCGVGGRILSPLPFFIKNMQTFPTTHRLNMVLRTKTKTITTSPNNKKQKAFF